MEDAHDIAHGLIARHGREAEAAAREQAEQCQAAGDVAGYERWRNALALVREFNRTGRMPQARRLATGGDARA